MEPSEETSLMNLIGRPATQEEADEFDRERFAFIEESTAACMRARGFQYEPRPYQENLQSAESDPTVEGYRMAPVMLAAWTGDTLGLPPIAEEADPNNEIVDQLKPAEQNAWFQALDGALPGSSPEEVAESLFENNQSCRTQARQLAIERFANSASQVLIDEYTEGLNRARQEPAVLAAQDGWTQCMSQKGYNFADQAEAMAHSSERLLEVSNAMRNESNGATTVSPELLNRLQRLADDEIALATADRDCAEPYREALKTAVASFQEDFLREHG